MGQVDITKYNPYAMFKSEVNIVKCRFKDKNNDFTEADSCWFNFDSAVERKIKLVDLMNNKDKFQYVENYFKEDQDPLIKELSFGIKKLEILEEVIIEKHLIR